MMKTTIALLMIILLFSGCKEAFQEPPRPPRCCTEIRIMNLASKSPALDGYVDYYNVQQRMIAGLGYREIFPKEGYWTMDGIDEPSMRKYPTYRMRLVHEDSTLIKNNILSDTNLLFVKGERYLAFLTDRAEKRPGWVILKDPKQQATIDPRATYIRILQLASDPALRLRITKNGQSTTPNVNYGQISNYMPLLPDIYTIELYSGNNFILSKTNMLLEAGKQYTFYYDGTNLEFFAVG